MGGKIKKHNKKRRVKTQQKILKHHQQKSMKHKQQYIENQSLQ